MDERNEVVNKSGKLLMQNWIKVTLILCAFGILREIRPSEPFVSEFLLGEWRNITEEQLNREVYPVGTYSYLAQLVVIFLVTDFLRFKPIIIISGLSGICVYAVLLWTSSIEWLQVSQFLYGMFMATEVAYYTYIYTKVDPTKYPLVTSYTRMALLTGRFLSGISSQLLTHYGLMNYRNLNYITFTAQILSTIWALWLPPVKYSIYFHRRASVMSQVLEPKYTYAPHKTSLKPLQKSLKSSVTEASILISRHAQSAFSRPKVIVWSALYATALALYVQAQTYMQLLWKQIQNDTDYPVAYNGAVEAATTLLGAGGSYLASFCTSASLPAPVAAAQGIAMFLATYVPNIFVSYAGYIVTGMLFHYTITLASAKIAGQLIDESCFGLIFGISTLLGTGLQSILTLVFIQSMQLPISSQYYAISGLYFVLASVWCLGWIVNSCNRKKMITINVT